MNLSRSAKPAAIENRFARVIAAAHDAVEYIASIDANPVVSPEEMAAMLVTLREVAAKAAEVAEKARTVNAAKIEAKAAKRAAKGE